MGTHSRFAHTLVIYRYSILEVFWIQINVHWSIRAWASTSFSCKPLKGSVAVSLADEEVWCFFDVAHFTTLTKEEVSSTWLGLSHYDLALDKDKC